MVLCYLLIDLPNLDIIAIFGGRINWLVRVRAHSRSERRSAQSLFIHDSSLSLKQLDVIRAEELL